jgi:hypothetical protein
MGKKRSTYRLLVGKPEGKRPLGKQRRRWISNIKMVDLRDGIRWCGLDWSGSGWVKVMNLLVLYNAGKLPSGCTTCGLSSGAQLCIVNIEANLNPVIMKFTSEYVKLQVLFSTVLCNTSVVVIIVTVLVVLGHSHYVFGLIWPVGQSV